MKKRMAALAGEKRKVFFLLVVHATTYLHLTLTLHCLRRELPSFGDPSFRFIPAAHTRNDCNTCQEIGAKRRGHSTVPLLVANDKQQRS